MPVLHQTAQSLKQIVKFLPEMMEKMYNDRVKFKKQMIRAKKEYQKNPSKELTKEIVCHNIQCQKDCITAALCSIINTLDIMM